MDKSGTFSNEELPMVIGTFDGKIYQFDPILRSKGEVKKFTVDMLPQEKKRSIEIIRWIENYWTEGARVPATSFIAVFGDGTIAIYHKDKDLP